DRCARDPCAHGEEQRPERRGGTRHGNARVVCEAGAFREIAREVEVDPRVVERKAGGARDHPLARQEYRQRQGGREDDEEVVAPVRGPPGVCSPHTRSAGGPPAACRGGGRPAARSRRAPAAGPSTAPSGPRTTRAGGCAPAAAPRYRGVAPSPTPAAARSSR